jgi:peptidoglycan hydrolase CwlO-like protein
LNAQPDPGVRFDQVGSTLSQLANSQRRLLTAQVLMNDRLERAETAIQKTAETLLTLADSQKRTDEKLAGVADKLDALTDIVRRWYERHGNGGSGQLPS